MIQKQLFLSYLYAQTALYCSDFIVRRAVHAFMTESGVPRDRIWITTKLWPNNRGRTDVFRALDDSLRRLNLTYVDLYLIHSPNDVKKRVEQWKAMEGTTAVHTVI